MPGADAALLHAGEVRERAVMRQLYIIDEARNYHEA